MHPILFHIGPLTVYSYGVMMAAAVIVCSFFLSRDARRAGLNSDLIVDIVFWVVISGLLGARIFFVLLNLEFFAGNPIEIFMIQNGGLSWQGGLILAAVVGMSLIRERSLPLWKTLDIFAPYIALGQSIGRIGCFFNGCCYGRPISWGIFFPVHQARLHPTQLYDALGLLVIFLILKRQKAFSSPKAQGEVFCLYLVLASFQRFVIEFFRADHTQTIGGLSIFQIISLCILIPAAYVTTRIKSRSRE